MHAMRKEGIIKKTLANGGLSSMGVVYSAMEGKNRQKWSRLSLYGKTGKGGMEYNQTLQGVGNKD